MFFQRLIVWCPCSFVVSLVINQQSKHVAGNVYVIYSLFLAFLFVQQLLFHSFCGESSVFFFMKASMVYLLKEQAPLSNESSYHHHMCVADENLTSRRTAQLSNYKSAIMLFLFSHAYALSFHLFPSWIFPFALRRQSFVLALRSRR